MVDYFAYSLFIMMDDYWRFNTASKRIFISKTGSLLSRVVMFTHILYYY